MTYWAVSRRRAIQLCDEDVYGEDMKCDWQKNTIVIAENEDDAFEASEAFLNGNKDVQPSKFKLCFDLIDAIKVKYLIVADSQVYESNISRAEAQADIDWFKENSAWAKGLNLTIKISSTEDK